MCYQKSSVEPFAQMKQKKQRIPRSEAVTKAPKFSRHQAIQLKVSSRQLMKFDHSHFYTGKSSPYIGSKIPKCCYLLSVFKTRNLYPPETFLFHFPFFLGGKTTQLDVTTKFNGCNKQRNGIVFQLILRSCFWHLHVCHEVVSPGIKRQRSRLDFLHSKGEGKTIKKTHSCD